MKNVSGKVHNSNDLDHLVIVTNKKSKFRQYITAFVANIISFGFGSVNGWNSPAQSKLQSDSPPIGTEPLTDDQIAWLGSIVFLGGVLGAVIWSQVADKWGRKIAGYMTATPFVLCGLITIYATNYLSLLIARFIVGLGCTGAIINVPLIVGDMADDTLRGPLGSSLVLFMNAGYLFSYTIGAFLSFNELNFLSLLVPIVFFLTFYWIPESPIFLISQQRLEEARKSLLWFRGNDSDAVEKEMKFLINQNDNKPHVNVSALFTDRGVFKGFLIGFILIMGQQITGINIVLIYTASIFEASGSHLEPNICTIIVGILQLVGSAVACVVVNKAGRKLLLLLTYFVISATLGAMGFCYYLIDIGEDISSIAYLPIVSLSVYVFAYPLGAGPVPFILFSEILPTYIRNLATSISFLFGILGSFFLIKFYPMQNELMGRHGTFWTYSFCSMFLFFYIMIFVPETKGRSVQSILKDLKGIDNCVFDDTESEATSRSSRFDISMSSHLSVKQS